MFLWSLYIPDSKKYPQGFDDCAICKAWTRKGARQKFAALYNIYHYIPDTRIERVKFNPYGIYVISDY